LRDPFSGLERFVELEYESQSATREALFDLPVSERVSSGMAIDSVRYRGTQQEGEQTLFVFSCGRNESKFRPGTRVRISRGDARRPAARLELVDDRHDGKEYVLRLAGRLEDAKALAGDEPWVLDEDSLDLLDAQLSILDRARGEGLGAWLEGTEELSEPSAVETDSPFCEGLSGSMRTAFRKALAGAPLFAVQGPPGSGKTHLLARLALHFAVEEGARVLITAVSHQAIHNALGETFWVGQRFPRCSAVLQDGIVKLGASRGKNEGLPAGVRAVFRVPRSKSPLVAGATVYGATRPGVELFDREYDVVLFDEAGQATLVLALGARLLGKRVVFIGDDAQLPPVIEAPPDEDIGSLARSSALAFIRKMYAPPFLLAESRRLNSELCSVVSGLFYGGALSPSAEAAGRTLALAREPAGLFGDILRPDKSLVFVDVPHTGCRSGSEPEAAWAAALVREAIRCGIHAAEIGVIAPFRAQANRIRFLLGRSKGTVCSTVERFQGQEREMTVLSLTSSHPRYLARLAAFVFDPNRLNVAVSRARTKVVVLGSREALSKAMESAEPDSEAAAGFSAFRRILEAAHPVAAGLTPPLIKEAQELPAADGFEPGDAVEHPRFGPGRVLSRSRQPVDGLPEWVHEIRFDDGRVRLVVPRLSKPPMKKLS